MTAAIPVPHGDARYMPTAYTGRSHEGTFTHYVASCEVCGADCLWTVKDPHGLCPCPDLEETAA